MKLNNQNNPLDLILLIEEQLRSTLSILKNCSEEIIQSWYSEEVKYLSEALQKTMNHRRAGLPEQAPISIFHRFRPPVIMVGRSRTGYEW